MNDQLRTDLASGADTFDLPSGDLGAVVQRGRRRNRRRHQLTATLAAVAIVATTVAAVRAANPDTPATNFATEGGAHLGDSGIEWARVADPDSAISAWTYQGTTELGGATYALSTAPGQQAGDEPLPPVVWRSTDGVEWEQASTPSGFRPNRLAAGDGRLYAIGTGPATAATTPSVHVGWSDGGDGAWADQALPLDLAALQAKSTEVQVVPTGVAADHGAVVAAVTVGVRLDVPKLLPAGEAAPHGWYLATDGVDVLGDGPECPAGTTAENPDPNVQRKIQAAGSIAADDAKKAEKAAADGRTVTPPTAGTVDPVGETARGEQYDSWCFSPDGTGRAYAPGEGRGVVAHHTWAELGVDGDLLRAVQGEPFLFRADAGSDRFERASVPSTLGVLGPPTIVSDGDGFVLVGSDRKRLGPKKEIAGLVVLTSTDGRTWAPDPQALPEVDGVQAIGQVDGHLAVVGGSSDSAIYAELRPGGWRTTSLTDLVGGGKGSWVGAAAIGPLGVVVSIGEAKGDVTTPSLLASRDGLTWSRTSVNDLVGGPGDVARIVIKDDRAVVTAVAHPEGTKARPEGTKARQVALVGTPR
ncbi:MAG: hypothetical protein JWN67_2510 [Actinomycetia bacterium]|nr:hypothetical protein [Actinomycetes bacterium]